MKKGVRISFHFCYNRTGKDSLKSTIQLYAECNAAYVIIHVVCSLVEGLAKNNLINSAGGLLMLQW